MARSIEYWRDLLSKSEDICFKAERILRNAYHRNTKDGNFVKKHTSWKSQEKKSGYKFCRITPVIRRGKTISKYWNHETAIGDRIYIKRGFYFKRPLQYDIAYKNYFKFATRMALVRKEIAKLQRKIAYCKEQINRLENK